MFRNGLIFRIAGALLLIGLVAAGGYMAYQAGEARGVSQAPVVATAIAEAVENGQAAPIPPMLYGHQYGYGYPIYSHHTGFFPFGICGSVLFALFFFGLLRMLFFRPWHGVWRNHKHGPWEKNGEGGYPSMFDEWHKRAHGEGEKQEADK